MVQLFSTRFAEFEWALRPIIHRTFGFGQASAFLPIEDPRYAFHRVDDITIFAMRVAIELGPPYLSVSSVAHLRTTFARAFVLSRQRKHVHIGAGLRTPDGKRFVSVLLRDERKTKSVVVWPVIGKTRSELPEETVCELWDHEKWLQKYPNYEEWLAKVLWATDSVTGAPILPKSLVIVPGVPVASDELPPGWPLRAHRDDKAHRSVYRSQNSEYLLL